jgi:hypothetical protein
VFVIKIVQWLLGVPQFWFFFNDRVFKLLRVRMLVSVSTEQFTGCWDSISFGFFFINDFEGC